MASRVKELDDAISSNFADTVARVIHMGGVDRQIDLFAAEILRLASVYRLLVIPLNLVLRGVLQSLWAKLLKTAAVTRGLMAPVSKPLHWSCVSS